MASDPFGKERQHPLKVGGFREAVIGTWKNFQPFRSRQGLEESLALVEGHIFIMITLDDQRGNGDCSGVIGTDGICRVIERTIPRPE